MTVTGEGQDVLPVHGDNLVARSAAVGVRPARLASGRDCGCSARTRVPPARGLGLVGGGDRRRGERRVRAGAPGCRARPRLGARGGRQRSRVTPTTSRRACWAVRRWVGATTTAPRTPYGSSRTADLAATVLVPEQGASTSIARALLPLAGAARRRRARRGAGCAVRRGGHRRPDLLLAATEDRLHQPYRASSMPETSALVRRLRAAGLAAVVSGAGPQCLVLRAAAADRAR